MASIVAKTYIHVFACSTGDQIRVYSCQLLPRNDVKAKTPRERSDILLPCGTSTHTKFESESPTAQRVSRAGLMLQRFTSFVLVAACPSKIQSNKASTFAIANSYIYTYMFNRASSACPRLPVDAERRCESNTIETCPSVESVKTFSRTALRCTQSSKSPKLLAHPFAPMFSTKGNRCRSRVLVLQYSHWKSSHLYM